ncbi:hypothetical protein CC1G_05950 [Coprinopsis cinerea okayama7|uniref:Uncharacterized protein n=1 Tax=Coprinopsis cinerea (strain Okayama-7 / 130 / ATCC MYA-4618 / FGSC 9003) TaxID=240176 RepID=A8NAJ9_COPC7|nr:hypothetical protein CC1G_05950 [Coprinopsis cinerea okayama7\|eukprot:XP_001831851.2 hypothetical protein CC1G_05950 [Coprinopsis cinerea okayama7\
MSTDNKSNRSCRMWKELLPPPSRAAAVSLTNSTTPHIYNLRTLAYLQPSAAHRSVRKSSPSLPAPSPNPPLHAHCHRQAHIQSWQDTMAKVAGICAKTSAPAVLDGPLNELEKQTEYAVLAAIDGFQSLFRKSADEECYQIAPYVYHRPRLVLEFVSGKQSFPSILL